MSVKVSNALEHLQSILPLKKNKDSCSHVIKRLYLAILRSFYEKGRVLNREEMQLLSNDLDADLLTLKEKDLIVLDDQNKLVGAYPFTMDSREHKVKVNNFELNAMCALDALSVSSLFKAKTVITSNCRVTQSKIYITQNNGAVSNVSEAFDIHVGISWSAASTDSCCANNLCLEMLFLIDLKTAQQWLSQDKSNREIFTLTEAIDFGALFFNPLLEA